MTFQFEKNFQFSLHLPFRKWWPFFIWVEKTLTDSILLPKVKFVIIAWLMVKNLAWRSNDSSIFDSFFWDGSLQISVYIQISEEMDKFWVETIFFSKFFFLKLKKNRRSKTLLNSDSRLTGSWIIESAAYCN
jgi:hypothetical protein